jgi:hypothetical protein
VPRRAARTHRAPAGTAIAIQHGHYRPEGTNQLHLAGLPSGVWADEEYWSDEIQTAYDSARWADYRSEERRQVRVAYPDREPADPERMVTLTNP